MWAAKLALILVTLYTMIITVMYLAQTWLIFPATLAGLAQVQLPTSAQRLEVRTPDGKRVLGQHRYEGADPIVSGKLGEEGEGDIDHALGLRDHDRAPPEPCQPVALSGIVPLDPVGLVLTRVALPHRQHVIDGIVIRAVEPGAPALQPFDQAFAGGLITTAALPVHQLA